jgi:hypothetical protein
MTPTRLSTLGAGTVLLIALSTTAAAQDAAKFRMLRTATPSS